MKDIYRWLNPEGLETISVTIPENCPIAEAVEATETGPHLIQLERPENGETVEIAVLHVWDDPTRSPALKRGGRGWRNEDPTDLLQQWETVRLNQFRTHMFNMYHAMQVIYLQPPTCEPVAFHHEGLFFEGWKVEMVAAFLAGFKVTGFDAYNDQPKIITDVRPPLKLVCELLQRFFPLDHSIIGLSVQSFGGGQPFCLGPRIRPLTLYVGCKGKPWGIPRTLHLFLVQAGIFLGHLLSDPPIFGCPVISGEIEIHGIHALSDGFYGLTPRTRGALVSLCDGADSIPSVVASNTAVSVGRHVGLYPSRYNAVRVLFRPRKAVLTSGSENGSPRSAGQGSTAFTAAPHNRVTTAYA